MEQAERHAIAALVERAEDRLEVGDGAGRPARRERRLGGPELERRGHLADASPGPAASSAPRRRRARRRRRLRSAPTGSTRLERELERGEGVLGRVGGLGPAGRVDRRRERPVGNVRRQPVAGRLARMGDEPGGEREVMAMAEARQEVRRPPPAGCARGGRRPRRLLDEDAGRERLLETRGEIRVEGSVAVPRQGRRSRREAIGGELERGRGLGQLVAVERPAGEGEQPQDPPALGPVPGQAGDHDVGERAGQGRVRQLAPGREQLLGDERQAARADRRRGRGPTRSAARPRSPGRARPARPARTAGSRSGPGRGPPPPPSRRGSGSADGRGSARPAASVPIRQTRCARRIRLMNDTKARRAGVGVVEVLEDEQDRLPLGQPADDAEQALEDPALAALERGRGRAVRQRPGRRQAPDDLGEEPDDVLGRGPARRASSASSTRPEDRPRAPGRSAPYGSSEPGRYERPRTTANGSSRPADAPAELVDEAA